MSVIAITTKAVTMSLASVLMLTVTLAIRASPAHSVRLFFLPYMVNNCAKIRKLGCFIFENVYIDCQNYAFNIILL